MLYLESERTEVFDVLNIYDWFIQVFINPYFQFCSNCICSAILRFCAIREVLKERLGPCCKIKMGMADNGVSFTGTGIDIFHCIGQEESPTDPLCSVLVITLYSQVFYLPLPSVGQG